MEIAAFAAVLFGAVLLILLTRSKGRTGHGRSGHGEAVDRPIKSDERD